MNIPIMTLPNCNQATVTYWQDANNAWWETFTAPGQPQIDNQIIRPSAATQTPPGEVLASRGLCSMATVGGPLPVASVGNSTAVEGTGGAAALLLLAIGGSAVWAYFQQRNDKGDFSDDYHPMADVPMLPPVATNENLDVIFERVGYPQYQGIDEPNPFAAVAVAPRPAADTQTTSPPVATRVSPVDATDFSTGDTSATADLTAAREYFEGEVLPAPRNGYSITDECLQNNGTAYQMIKQAVILGYSQNWISEYLFKASKGSTKYNLVRDMVNRCKGEVMA